MELIATGSSNDAAWFQSRFWTLSHHPISGRLKRLHKVNMSWTFEIFIRRLLSKRLFSNIPVKSSNGISQDQKNKMRKYWSTRSTRRKTKILVYDNHNFDDYIINHHEYRIIFPSNIAIRFSGHYHNEVEYTLRFTNDITCAQ